ncbi:ATP-binding protein [Nocardiopsis mangrovi]|uniref:ATP-binding protein n=1 Tax=Nocardiopsis mangrovi TaxID=1179818 RepID=A0ABV9DRZ6_9ACTN
MSATAPTRAARAPGLRLLHRLDGVPEAASTARDILVLDLGPRHPYLYNAQLVVSELATNAVTHTRSGLPGGFLILYVEATAQTARIEVGDAGPLPGARTRPRIARPDADSEHGRGLALVDAFTDDWGTRRHADGTSTVWAHWSGEAP